MTFVHGVYEDYDASVSSVAARGRLPPGANVYAAAPASQNDRQLIFLWLQ